MENIPTIYFYEDDFQINGRVSENAVVRECQSLGPCLNPRLITELKYLDHGNEPIRIQIGKRGMFQVQFMKEKKD